MYNFMIKTNEKQEETQAKSKKKSYFGLVLIILVILAHVAIGFGGRYLWNYLSIYESSLPNPIIESMFQDIKDKNFFSINLMTIENRDDTIDFWNTEDVIPFINTDNIFYYQSGQSAPFVTYSVISDNSEIARITLKKQDNTQEFPNGYYTPDSIRFFPNTELTIISPSHADVYLDNKSVTLSQDEIDVTEHLTELGKDEISTVKTVINTFGQHQNFNAYIWDDIECDLDFDVENNILTFSYPITDEEKEKVTTFAEQYCKDYMVYTTESEILKSTVLRHVLADTDLADNINKYSNYWGQTILRSEFDKMEISTPVKLSEFEYSCEISANFHINWGHYSEKNYTFDFEIFVTEVDQQLKVYRMDRIEE